MARARETKLLDHQDVDEMLVAVMRLYIQIYKFYFEFLYTAFLWLELKIWTLELRRCLLP